MDTEECYAWGELFTRDRDALATGMSQRAGAMGLTQHELDGILIWKRDEDEECRWVFIDDPSDIEQVRMVYNNDENTQSPCCFVVVKQPDASDTRGDIIFDIFRLNPESSLWHFNRVYTRPKTAGTER